MASSGPLALAVLDAAVDEPFADDVAGRRLALSRLITAANAEAPIRLARFASLVSDLAPTDPAAAAIVAEAAELLTEQAHIARAPARQRRWYWREA